MNGALRLLICILIFVCASVIIITTMSIPAIGTPQQTTVKHTPVQPSHLTSGPQMYLDYCAPCHGVAGKGDGPAAPALKTSTPDLTLLAKNNGGKYPSDRVSKVLDFGAPVTAHGSSDMPIWGPLFRSMDKGQLKYSKLRISNLTKHVETLQTK